MNDVKNLFVEEVDAHRYDRHRPLFHAVPYRLLRDFWGRPIPLALDVACGTGHSTEALAAICDKVIGCDPSENMLKEARRDSKLEYVLASAEELPFPDGQFDYVNLSMAFQWLDQPRFLRQAHRVLKPEGSLGLLNYGFRAVMVERPEFAEVFREFEKLYLPKAPRFANYPSAVPAGFGEPRLFPFEDDVRMNCDEFVNYLMTRSNFLNLSPADRPRVEERMRERYNLAFGNENRTLKFTGVLRLYPRQ